MYQQRYSGFWIKTHHGTGNTIRYIWLNIILYNSSCGREKCRKLPSVCAAFEYLLRTPTDPRVLATVEIEKNTFNSMKISSAACNEPVSCSLSLLTSTLQTLQSLSSQWSSWSPTDTFRAVSVFIMEIWDLRDGCTLNSWYTSTFS